MLKLNAAVIFQHRMHNSTIAPWQQCSFHNRQNNRRSFHSLEALPRLAVSSVYWLWLYHCWFYVKRHIQLLYEEMNVSTCCFSKISSWYPPQSFHACTPIFFALFQSLIKTNSSVFCDIQPRFHSPLFAWFLRRIVAIENNRLFVAISYWRLRL